MCLLAYLILPEPEFVEVNAESDIEVILLDEQLWRGNSVFPLKAYVDHRLGGNRRSGQSEAERDSVVAHVVPDNVDIVAIVMGSDAIDHSGEVISLLQRGELQTCCHPPAIVESHFIILLVFILNNNCQKFVFISNLY